MDIEKNFDNILYEKYLHGELPYNRLCLICNCTCYEMDKYLKIKNLKHRQYYLENYTQHNFFDSIDSELKAYFPLLILYMIIRYFFFRISKRGILAPLI